MTANCNILYQGNIADIRIALATYIKQKNINNFLERFIKGSIPEQTRYTKTTLDDSDDLQKSIKSFNEDLELTIQTIVSKKPSLEKDLDELRKKVLEVLHIDLDESQSGSISEFDQYIEAKTKDDLKDLFASNLADHIKDIYGTGSYDIIKTLKENFGDDITSQAYWNINSGSVVLKNDTILNKNFQEIKNKYYKQIVQYLKQAFPNMKEIQDLKESMIDNNKFIGSEYFQTISKFYKYIKTMDSFYNTILQDQSDKLNDTIKATKINSYIKMMKVLMQNEDFSRLVKNKYNNKKLSDLQNKLYEADYFSEYYIETKRLINKFNLGNLKVDQDLTVNDIISQIESKQLTLLNAVNSYTSLVHFDELLLEQFGNSFSITPNLQGVEMGDMTKYKHHQDTAHERKGWQLSESVDSERYTANLTKQIFNQVRVFSYKTNTYQNRRVNSTQFIVAARNLLNDIIYNNIQWNISQDVNSKKRQVFDKFIKNVLDIHSNPEDRFQKTLDYLFGDEQLYNSIIRKKSLTEYDLDILYSIYNAIYNKNNPNSLISRELNSIKLNNGRVQNLVQEISGYVDRNTTMDYLETSYDPQTQQVVSRIKKKYFNNIELYKTRTAINVQVNNVTTEKAINLRNKYNFRVEEATNKYTYYKVDINDETISLMVPNFGGKILVNDKNISYEDSSIFTKIDNIDLVNFRDKIMYDGDLTEDEKVLKTMLQFIDDHLGFNIISNPSYGIQVLATYKTIYNPSGDNIVGKSFMMPLMQLAIRAAYANSRYAEANGEQLGKYLESLGSKDDGIYQSFKRNEKKSKLFSQRFGNVKYTIASYDDKVLDLWCDAKSMLSGEASKATTKDKFGNAIPNNSVNKLGTNLFHYLNKQTDTNVNSLFFVENKSLIRSVVHDLEVTTWNGDSKSLRSFSNGELFFHAIFNKFWGNYLNNGNVIVQPTVYSDKTTFINYEVNTLFDGTNDIIKNPKFKEQITQLYIDSIGQAYKNIWYSTKNKLQQIANLYNQTNGTNLTYKQVLKSINEKQLINLANQLGLTVELDKDYRNIKYVDSITGKTKSGLVVNEMLEYYSEVLYNNSENLERFLKSEQINFIKQLVQSGSYFQVLNFGDKVDNYLDDKISEKANSNNPIINTILSFYEDVDKRKDFFSKWVDAKTGKLILAKQNGKNILGMNDKVSDAEVTVNPLLERFFYIEGFISNNLRMSLTGSEINHPNKAKGLLLDKAKKAKTVEDFEKLGITISNSVINTLREIINNTSYVGDLLDTIKSLNPGKVADALNTIYSQSLLTITNVAQGTQFKRNVIIPATLQYCQQNVREGISPKTKCAVIRDEGAHVWNYRGDYENDIDSADGSAQINPFQSILENRSLGSQAVGFTKKPIWHSYDSNSGTAFLAKFATNTITNESMRMSLLSHTSMFNLFKKMTNLQWQGDVDLTESITLGKLGNNLSRVADIYRWFQTSILGNSIIEENGKLAYVKDNRLLYKNKYDKIIEIVGFDKTVSDGIDLYYTKELPYLKNNSDDNAAKKVYHVFYDIKDSNGNITEKSKHLTFDSYQKAKNFIVNNEGAHTINSLFELHTALGGINCVDADGNISEFSNEVVVNFMNNVGNVKEGVDRKTDIVNQENYNQPLKNYHIGYALNNTAVKNGAKNINPESSWYDDTDLSYFEVDSDGLGMQMNADHDIIDSTLTEFSQVVAATSAYGYTHEYCAEIFKGLALASSQASKKLLDSIDNFLESNFSESERAQAKSDLYEAVGRILLVNESIKDKESLQSIIMEAVTKIFYKSKDHNQDSYKIPFSDSNIYSEFISTLASTINKDSIKRTHPGSGCVIVAGYNIAQYYEIDGTKYFIDDILPLAKEDYKQELNNILKNVEGYDSSNNTILVGENKYYLNNQSIEYLEDLIKEFKLENTSIYNQPELVSGTLYQDITSYNKNIIKAYLNKKQLNAKTFDNKSWYMPSDIVDIVDSKGNLLKTVDLNSLDTYYKFKDGIYDTELEHNVSVKVEYKKYKYTISLNEDPNTQFVIEGERDLNGTLTGKYNIHFKTGGFNSELQRRTPWVGNDIEQKKIRLFRAALEVLPVGSILRLSPTTEQQINERKGGLTSGSIAGYTSILSNEDRREGIEIVPIGNSYEVKYFDKDGIIHSTQVNEYKKVSQKAKPYRYRVNVTKPHNLRPSLIRWQYLDNEGKPQYMNIFDTKVIKDAYIFPENKPSDYRIQIQDVLHKLHEGTFTDYEGNSHNLIEGTLENTEAELLMSNIYKEKFGVKDGDSLSYVLSKGKYYFKQKKLNPPVNTLYDIAFLKDTGNHTLITLGEVNDSNYISELPFNNGQLSTNEKDEIVLMKGNRELFEVGKWINYGDKVLYDNGVYIDAKTKEVLSDQNLYRLKDASDYTSVQKKINYLTRYIITDKVEKQGKVIYKQNTLYKIANLSNFEEALGNREDAAKQRASLVNKLYQSDNYKIAQVNINKTWSEEKLNHVKSSLGFIQSNKYIKESVKNLLQAQLDSIDIQEDLNKKLDDPEQEKLRKQQLYNLKQENKKKYNTLLEEFLENESTNKWVSFQDSLKFIASRIPAQTLQSFMTMKLVGWTKNSKNMAYVSHFQTYLQGSDY